MKDTLPRNLIVSRIHRWGSSVVESLLDPTTHIFSHPDIDGLIGYKENRKCMVVFGDPVCSPTDRAALVHAFHRASEKKKKNVIYLVASHEFANWMHEEQHSGLIPFGEELYLDPFCDPRGFAGKKGISLRGKIRHAEKKGVAFREYKGEEPDLECKIQEVAHRWLQHRQGPQIYISKVRLFNERLGRRWFYALQDDKVIGSFLLNQLKLKKGWILDRIMTVPEAPPGTSEMMIVLLLEQLAQEGCQFLSFGASNGVHLGHMKGFGTGTTYLAQTFYKVAQKFFKIDSKRKYWEKFHPQRTPTYLVFRKPQLGFHEIRGLMQALNVSFQ